MLPRPPSLIDELKSQAKAFADQLRQMSLSANRVERKSQKAIRTLVRDEVNEVSECWLIDCRDFEAGPVAKVRVPGRVPYGFHAHWVSAEQAATQRLRARP